MIFVFSLSLFTFHTHKAEFGVIIYINSFFFHFYFSLLNHEVDLLSFLMIRFRLSDEKSQISTVRKLEFM